MAGPDGALIRGAHWRNFLVKYPESNRMHKKMQALSLLCRRWGVPPAARRAIGRAQCNDAYWHGVFGGLYLPHLREAVWRNLAQAEQEFRRGQELSVEVLDLDGDGHDEIWIHSDQFSALVSPRRGGAVEELTIFATETNYASTLTRRREAYHDTALENQDPAVRPPIDAEDRALLVDRVLPERLPLASFVSGEYPSVHSWAASSCSFRIEQEPELIEIVCSFRSSTGETSLEKRLGFASDGSLRVRYRWDPRRSSGGSLCHRAFSVRPPRLAPGAGGRGLEFSHRDRGQVGARARPYPAGRVDHIALAGRPGDGLTRNLPAPNTDPGGRRHGG